MLGMLGDKGNWANIITSSRLLFLPLFIISAIADQPRVLAGLFVFHSAVDVLDGLVARWLHTQSDFGRRLDTLVDMLVWIPGVLIFLWFVRDELSAAFSAYPHLFIVPVITSILMNLIAYHYLGSFAAMHLYTAKLTAGMVFILLLIMLIEGFSPLLGYLTAIIGIIYHLEASAIYLLKKGQTDENVTSLWQVIGQNLKQAS